MRVSLEGLGQAVDGDMTTTGAICIATGEGYLDEGRMVLRMGDPTTPCPLCGLEGKVVEGVWHFISDGQPVAMDGALVDCGCPEGTNRVIAPLGEMPPPWQPVAARTSLEPAGPGSSSTFAGASPVMVGALPGQMQPGFYVVPRSMSFPQILLELATHDSTLPISHLQRLNPTFEQGFKAGEIFVIGDPDDGYACTQEEGQLMAAFLNKQLNLGAYERLKKSLNISTKSLVHHWSKAGGPGQIPGYATYLDKVAKLSKYLKHGGYVGIGLGGTSSYLKVQEVCRAGETDACRKVRLTEAGSFSLGTAGATFGSAAALLAVGTLCGAVTVGSAGLGAPVCGIVLVGSGSMVGGIIGEKAGEFTGEFIYEG